MRFGGLICPICLAATLVTRGAAGANTNTNDVVSISSSFRTIMHELNRPPGQNSTFLERVGWNIECNGPAVVTERFGYSAAFSWLQWQIQGVGQEKAVSQGIGAFGDIVSDSVIDSFLFVSKIDHRSVGGGFIHGTLDTVEPHLKFDTAEPNEVRTMQRSIDSFDDDWKNYGVNLINSNPYFHLSFAPLRNKSHVPIFILYTRARVMFLSDRIGAPRIDQEVLFPLQRQTQLSLGCRCYPTRFNEPDWQPSFTARLTHQLGRTTSGNVIYASVKSEEKERARILLGFSFHWR